MAREWGKADWLLEIDNAYVQIKFCEDTEDSDIKGAQF